jgi:hypothetical protein
MKISRTSPKESPLIAENALAKQQETTLKEILERCR